MITKEFIDLKNRRDQIERELDNSRNLNKELIKELEVIEMKIEKVRKECITI